MVVGFAGLSHLGVVSSVATASQGYEVVAYDPDPGRARELEAGRLPSVEHGLPELFASSRSRLRFTHRPESLEACALIFCSSDVSQTQCASTVSSPDIPMLCKYETLSFPNLSRTDSISSCDSEACVCTSAE